MPKTAIIFAEAAEARRAIAQLIKPSGLFAKVCFSSTAKEVDFLLQNSQADMIFCNLLPTRDSNLRCTEELARLASSRQMPIVYCSQLTTKELRQLNIIPVDSPCLSYQTTATAVTQRLTRLLNQGGATPPRRNTLEKLIDKGTGVYNRFYFDSFLDHEISRSKLTGRPFSLLLIEPQPQPAPKAENWNRMLPTIAQAIKQQVRGSDLLCRVEEKRFALLLPETSDLNAEQVASRIRHKFQEGTTENTIGLNFGLASSSYNKNYNRQGLLQAAEAGL